MSMLEKMSHRVCLTSYMVLAMSGLDRAWVDVCRGGMHRIVESVRVERFLPVRICLLGKHGSRRIDVNRRHAYVHGGCRARGRVDHLGHLQGLDEACHPRIPLDRSHGPPLPFMPRHRYRAQPMGRQATHRLNAAPGTTVVANDPARIVMIEAAWVRKFRWIAKAMLRGAVLPSLP